MISVLVHGMAKLMVTLNGWNSRCVAFITGRDIRQEAGRAGQSFDLVSHLRVRRLKWVGHVLRMDDSRFVKQAMKALWTKKRSGELSREGTALMDTQTAARLKSYETSPAQNDKETSACDLRISSRGLCSLQLSSPCF